MVYQGTLQMAYKYDWYKKTLYICIQGMKVKCITEFIFFVHPASKTISYYCRMSGNFVHCCWNVLCIVLAFEFVFEEC